MSHSPTCDTVSNRRVEAGSLTHDDRRALYEYVHEHGPIGKADLEQAVFPYDQRAFEHHLALLKSDGYLTVNNNQIRMAVDYQQIGMIDTTIVAGDDTRITIRPAVPQERTELRNVIRQVAGDQTHVEAEAIAKTVAEEDQLFRDDSHKTRVFFVATTDDTIVGWVHLTIPSFETLRHTATLTGGIVESYRDLGVGSSLLQEGLTWASNHDIETIYQRLPSTNTDAIDFLETHGWQVEAVRTDHYKIDDEYVDEIQMATEVS